MFTQAEHLHGWLAYGLGAAIGLLCWWYLLYKMPIKPIRPLLMGAMTGLLITPWTTEEGSDFFAPAWLIAGSDGFFESADAFWRAGLPLLISIACFTGLAIALQVAFMITGRKQRQAENTAKRARQRADGQQRANGSAT